MLVISGTIKNSVQQMQLASRWEQKKRTGDVLRHESKNKELTTAEKLKQQVQEQQAEVTLSR